jgi:hypothetical protein
MTTLRSISTECARILTSGNTLRISAVAFWPVPGMRTSMSMMSGFVRIASS